MYLFQRPLVSPEQCREIHLCVPVVHKLIRYLRFPALPPTPGHCLRDGLVLHLPTALHALPDLPVIFLLPPAMDVSQVPPGPWRYRQQRCRPCQVRSAETSVCARELRKHIRSPRYPVPHLIHGRCLRVGRGRRQQHQLRSHPVQHQVMFL